MEKLHAEMRAVFGVPGMSLGSPEAARKLKEVKKDVEVGPLPGEYVIVTSHPFLTGENGGNTLVFKQDFPPEGKTLLNRPHPESCICPKCNTKTEIVSTVKRIGDTERDACLEFLRDRHVSGHITLEEFETRKDKALTARSQHELDYLTQDLPALLVMKPAVTPEVRHDREVTTFLCRIVSAAFPVMAAITILMGATLAGAAVLAIVGGLAAFLLTFLQLRP